MGDSVLMTVLRMLNEGYDNVYIEEVMGLDNDGDLVEVIDILRKSDYKNMSEDEVVISVSQLLGLYINGFTFEEIGILTKYSKEGIRNRIIGEIDKEGRKLKDCKDKNKEMRKSIRDCLFYELYLRDLDEDNIHEAINRSPYSESTFIKKMKELR